MYYGYIDDTLFQKKTTITNADEVYPACVMDRQIGNYFNKNIRVGDPRSTRLNLGGKAANGKISFHYDKSKHPTDVFDQLSNDDLIKFFNVLELIYTANGDSRDTINYSLASGVLTKDVYVADTLALSRTSVTGTIYNIDDTTPTMTISLVTYFDFHIKFEGKDEEIFRVWLDRETFLADYPLTTINNVVLPCDKIYILDPTKISGVIEMMIKSNTYSFADLDQSIETEDHSGFMTYLTKYITKSPSATQMLPFGILYQGAKPSSLEIREAIRNDLLKGGIADASVWESILPDLFVTAQFYIVPVWDNTTIRSFGVINPSIINAYKYKNVLKKIFPNMDDDYIDTNQEMMVCGQSELFLTTIPDPLNKDKFSLLKEHPSYQYHMSQDGSVFTNMDPITQDFNKRLNRAMAIACGESTSLPDVTDNVIDTLTWHTFTTNKVEYNILSRASYYKVLGLSE